MNNKINDFYFISKEYFTNHMIKDEISSFLSTIKVIFIYINVFLDTQTNSNIISINIINTLFIYFFKTNLTEPKVKDLVNKPKKGYHEIYKTIEKSAPEVQIYRYYTNEE